MLYKNANGTLTTLYTSPAFSFDDDLLGVKKDFVIPSGFAIHSVSTGDYGLLRTV